MLRAENISMKFDEKQVINNISLDIEKGKITGLIGRNGSGKTTVLRILSQITRPDSGHISLEGQDLLKMPELKEKIAYLPDNFNYFPYENTKKIIEYYKTIYDDFDEDFALNELGDLGLPININSRKLSKGQRTLLGIVIILASQADYLLLDEVLDGMDVLNIDRIIKYLLMAQDQGRSVFLASHQLDELEAITDKVYYLSLEGSLLDRDLEDAGLLKYQLVVKDHLDQDLKENMVIKDNIARVYTVLVRGDKKTWEARFDKAGIVQYDLLPAKLEDMFFYERGENDGKIEENL